MTKYTRLFIEESRVYIPGIAAILARLRAGCPEELDVREGQRLAHSIKGMALFEEQPGVAALTWAMERGFERLRGECPGDGLADSLEAALPLLSRMIDEVESAGSGLTDPAAAVAAIESRL